MEFSCLTLEINIKVILKMVYMMVLENIKLFNKDHMQGILKRDFITEKVYFVGERVINTKDNTRMGKETEKEYSEKVNSYIQAFGPTTNL